MASFEWPNPTLPKPSSRVVETPKDWKDEALLVPHEAIRWWKSRLLQIMEEFDPLSKPTSSWKTKVLFDFLDQYYIPCIYKHHRSEEEIYNPGILEKCKSMGLADPFPKIKSDHEKLISQLERLASFRASIAKGDASALTEFKSAVKEMVAFMEEHLAEEERDYPKIFDSCGLSQEEEGALVTKILESLGLDGNKRLLPPIMYCMAKWKGKEGMLQWYESHVPPPIKMLNNNCWVNDFQEKQLKVLEALKQDEHFAPQDQTCNLCSVM